MQDGVVADVDDRGDRRRIDDLDEPGEEAGGADAAGEHGDQRRSSPFSSARSASTIIVHQLGEGDLRLPAEHLARALRRVADQQVDLGRAEEPLVLHDVVARSRARRARTRARRTRGPSGSRPVEIDEVARRRPAAASTTSPRRSRRRSPSRAAPRGCRDAARCRCPSLMRATPWLTLRSTNSSPRRGELVVEQDAAASRAGRSDSR